jgi:glutathione-regulated potassium-efflux system ancillary protein KefG
VKRLNKAHKKHTSQFETATGAARIRIALVSLGRPCYRIPMSQSAPGRILFIVAHPYLEKSRANKSVVRALEGIDGVTMHNLYDRYPYFHIDVPYEKQLLLSHEIIVVQHPMYWYSMPALLKLWLDDVFESGWAYGPGGDKLKGKKLMVSITMGGPEDAYTSTGYNRYNTGTFLAAWDQTAHLCQMQWLEPVLFHGSIRATPADIESYAQKVRSRVMSWLVPGGNA